MSETAISVRNLGKKYNIGQSKSGDLRETFGNLFRSKDTHSEINGLGHSKLAKEFWALQNVNFEVSKGEAVGIIGKNGAGKSTLLKILSRITSPTTGRIEINGRVSSLLEVGTGFHAELTGKENIYLNGTILGMKRKEIKLKYDEIVAFSGVEKFLDTPIKHYSSGMKVRLAFSVAAYLEPEILLIDEVLAVGDADFQKKCLGKMEDVAKHGRTVMFVSHNMGAIKKLCDKTILLQDASIQGYDSSTQIIEKYLQMNESSYKEFDHQIVKSAQVSQFLGKLKIEVRYENYLYNSPPSMGIIVSDRFGNIVFGTSPRMQGFELSTGFKKEGKIIAEIKDPILNRGDYFISLAVGDGGIEFFNENNVIMIRVAESKNMVNSELYMGSVVPDLTWFYA